jgi:adenosylhomocysteine nucleosidase
MVSREPLLLVVAADQIEFGAFAAAGHLPAPIAFGVRWSAQASLNGRSALLVANGAGRKNAAAAVQKSCEKFDVQAVISTGFVGALDADLRAGDVFLASQVTQFEPRLEYPVRLPVCSIQPATVAGKLLTVDEVVQSTRRKQKLRESGFEAVDMEASAVAAEAARRNLPIYCVRAVSDEAGTSFEIDFNRCRRADGTFSGWRIAAQAGISPRRWKNLLALRQGALQASMALGTFFGRARFEN